MQKLKNIFTAALLGLVILNPTLAIAQTPAPASIDGLDVPEYKNVEGSISQYLCTPSVSGDGHDLERCINKLYRFGISFGAVAVVFFLVFAGYMYMTGGESGKTKAKGIVQNAVVGIVLLLGSYVLLRFINPNLVIIKPIQAPIFTAADLPSCEEAGLGHDCVADDGKVIVGGGGGSAGSGDPFSATSCAASASNCVKFSAEGIPCHAGGCSAQRVIIDKLKILKTFTDQVGVKWSVGQAYPPSGRSKSECHKTGACVDISLNGAGSSPSTTENWVKLCESAKKVPGTGFLNELINSNNSTTTTVCGRLVKGGSGDHLHFVILR